MNPAQRARTARSEVQAFNRDHPVGAPVRYWKGKREGEGILTRTRTEAQVLGSHTAVVWVEGYGSCVALSHVQPEPEGH